MSSPVPFDDYLVEQRAIEQAMAERNEARGRQLAQLDGVLFSAAAGGVLLGGMDRCTTLLLGGAVVFFLVSLAASVVVAWPLRVPVASNRALDELTTGRPAPAEEQHMAIHHARVRDIRKLRERMGTVNKWLMASYVSILVGLGLVLVAVAVRALA